VKYPFIQSIRADIRLRGYSIRRTTLKTRKTNTHFTESGQPKF